MKKYLILGVVLLLLSVPCVMANGNGGLRISPAWPVMVESPATFTIWSQTGDAYGVLMFVVISQECYGGMGTMDVVTIEYGMESVTLDKSDFDISLTGNGKIPDSTMATEGAKYTYASLREHLSYGLSTPITKDDTIYCSIVDLSGWFDPLTLDPKEITITLDSSEPRMLIYLWGKSECADLYDMKVPPTNPGFVIPEVAVGSVMAVASMFTALGLYAYKKKHTPT